MAEPSDGNYLCLGLSGSNSLAQFHLLTQSVGPVIPINHQTTSPPVLSLAAMPGSTMITLTDSNFPPGVALTWNGSDCTTTIVATNHVTVALPASDHGNGSTTSLVANPPWSASVEHPANRYSVEL